MIFLLDATPEQLGDLPADLLVHAISELLRAHRKGNHLAVVPRLLSSWIIENVPLSSNDLALVARLGQEFTQTGSLARNASIYIRLIPAPMLFPSHPNCIDVSFQEILDSNIIEKPYLLLEDAQNDGKIYRFIFDMIQKRNRFANLSFVPFHGGGSGSLRMLGQIIEEKRVVAVVLDSDRKSPFHPMPNKFRQHKEQLTEANWRHGVVVTLPCREIENLIPVEALEALPCSTEKVSTLSWLRECDDADDKASVPFEARTAMFFDLKLGIEQQKVLTLPIPEARDWWTSRLGDRSVAGFGPHVAAQVVASGKAMSSFRDSMLRTGILDFLENLFEKVIWLFLAAAPLRA